MDMTVNRLPSRTWNQLGMNESRISGIEIERKYPLSLELSGQGLEWNPEEPEDAARIWAEIETGMGPDMDRLGSSGEPDLLMSAPGTFHGEPAVLDLALGAGEKCSNTLHMFAGKGSTMTAAVICRSTDKGEGIFALQTKIYAQKGARVRLYMVQLLDKDCISLNDIGGICGEGAQVEIVRLELGAGKAYAGGLMDLMGDNSSFQARIGYSGGQGQHLDMNYTARHRGIKTESLMDASGVLTDDAFKLFRGTIDFISGSSGSKGEEKEDVLLLGENMVNQTIPLILCGEDDVEGNHGATIGKLDERMMFYLYSRGISKENAEQMMARARIDALCERIPVRKIREQVYTYLEGGQGNGEL